MNKKRNKNDNANLWRDFIYIYIYSGKEFHSAHKQKG